MVFKEGKILRLEYPSGAAERKGYKSGDIVTITHIYKEGSCSRVSYKSLCKDNSSELTISVNTRDNFYGASGTKRFKEIWE